MTIRAEHEGQAGGGPDIVVWRMSAQAARELAAFIRSNVDEDDAARMDAADLDRAAEQADPRTPVICESCGQEVPRGTR